MIRRGEEGGMELCLACIFEDLLFHCQFLDNFPPQRDLDAFRLYLDKKWVNDKDAKVRL